MYENIKTAFDSLINKSEFQILVREYRQRFGIPENGFNDLSSDGYKNWIKSGLQKSDLLKDQFLFLAKKCRNLIPDRDPIPFTLLAYYFIFNKQPTINSEYNECLFTIVPSGILGNFDITFTIPLLFTIEKFLEEVEKHKEEISQLSVNSKMALTNLSASVLLQNNLNPNDDFLATTPGNGADIVDRVHRDIGYLAEFGRVVLRQHLNNMKDVDFVINCYEDKNKPIYQPIQHMGGFLLNRGLYPIAEEYWKHIDDEIQDFNKTTGKRVNRGIPLANAGVSQIAQGKIIEGLFNIYHGYQDDKECLKNITSVSIDPEKDMANSILFTQFEDKQTHQLFISIISKFQNVFQNPLTISDLNLFITSLQSDKKLLFYMVIYRYSFASGLNNQLTTVISRSEIIRSMAELALWFEDEMKRKNTTLRGHKLVEILDQKVGQLNPTRGQFTSSTDLNELLNKISSALSNGSSLEITNARVMGCLRNFAGHNLDVQDHNFFQISDEVFARMLSFIMYSKSQGWI
jgi:hypothetical protein